MTIQEVIDEYGSEILGLGLGRRSLAAWLTENLDGNFTEHFARRVLRELDKVTEPPEPIQENEARSIEQALRDAYGIYDESWQPTKIWGNPSQPNAKWERRLDANDPKRLREIIDNLGDGTDLPWTRDYEGEPMGVLAIRDTHFGMFAEDATPYHRYDLEEAVESYLSAASSLMGRLYDEGVSHFVYPIGSDGIHTDGVDNATTKGTPQDVSTPWWRAYEAYLSSVNDVVSEALDRFDTVTVVMEPGNHDRDSARSLGYALKAKWDGEAEVLASLDSLKMVATGGSRVFFTHGSDMKPEMIPTVLMNDFRKELRGATYVEVQTGHLHHRRRGVLKQAGDYLEDGGVVMRISPAFCPSGVWSRSQGYRSEPGGQAMTYDADGFRALFEWRP